MKRIIFPLLFLVFFSCKKKEVKPTVKEIPLKTNFELIINKDWIMTTWLVSPKMGNDTNLFDGQFPCAKDDINRYLLNDVFELDQGNEKCYPNDPQIRVSSWKLMNDTLIRDNQKLTLINVSENSLSLSVQQKLGNTNYTYTLKYKCD